MFLSGSTHPWSTASTHLQATAKPTETEDPAPSLKNVEQEDESKKDKGDDQPATKQEAENAPKETTVITGSGEPPRKRRKMACGQVAGDGKFK